MHIGIDIGGTSIKVAGFTDNKLFQKTSFPVNQDFTVSMELLCEEVEKLAEGNQIEGIGIAAPGDIDVNSGSIVDSVNLPQWNGKSIKNFLENKFKVEVKVDNDVKLASVGEAVFGEGKNLSNFLFVIWGTGFAGSYVRIIEKEIDAVVVELGHQILDWNGPVCTCGQKGCAEVYVGGGQSEKTYGAKFSENTGDNVWEKVSRSAGHALINAINYFPVNLIVFGGGVINKQEHLIEKVKDIVRNNLKTYPVPEMKLSTLGEDAGVWGSYAILSSKIRS